MRLAKIIATLGPASQDPDTIGKLLLAGANIIRLNFSHGDHENLARVIRDIRNISREMGLHVGILGDLQGPKFRIGELEGHRPVFLEQGTTLRFTAEKIPGTAEHLTTNTPQIVEELRVGDDVLLDDGSLRLEVLERKGPGEVVCRVMTGGLLGEKKGINVPGLKMANVPALTEKDKVDARFALAHALDFIALSFVRSAQDIQQLRDFLQGHLEADQRLPWIVAKIEKPQALEEIDGIIDLADAIMVARGDLGVEMRPERVPAIQKMIINKANDAEKPVITATQILESMINFPNPTRAEVSDVANAVFDGSDALMLSGETAVGKYPVDAVQTMARIIQESEGHYGQWHRRSDIEERILDGEEEHLQFHQVIAQAACLAAQKADTKAIVVVSYSGKMARRIAKRKPSTPIIAITPEDRVCRRLSLLWGIYPLQVKTYETTESTLVAVEQAILDQGYLHPKDPIVFCAGQTHLTGITNTLKIYPFGDVVQQLPPQSSGAPEASAPLVRGGSASA